MALHCAVTAAALSTEWRCIMLSLFCFPHTAAAMTVSVALHNAAAVAVAAVYTSSRPLTPRLLRVQVKCFVTLLEAVHAVNNSVPIT